jgi:hypothetical protein
LKRTQSWSKSKNATSDSASSRTNADLKQFIPVKRGIFDKVGQIRNVMESRSQAPDAVQRSEFSSDLTIDGSSG